MSDWIEWKGGPCPVLTGTQVEVRDRRGMVFLQVGSRVDWDWEDAPGDVVAYRVVAKAPTQTDDITTVLTERGNRYGPFVGHANVTQALKIVIADELRHRNKVLARDQQEALDMICHKIGRIINGDPDYDDSWVDIAGYAKLVADRLQGVTR